MEQFMQMLRKWAADNDHIESIIIVGSYARGTSHAASDLDLVIITSEKAALTEHQDFTGYFWQCIKKTDRILRRMHLCPGLVQKRNGSRIRPGISLLDFSSLIQRYQQSIKRRIPRCRR